MRKDSYAINCRLNMTAEEYMESLDSLTRAAHSLVTGAIDKDVPANSPDLQALFAACGNLNVALSYARAIAAGQQPGEAPPGTKLM